MEHLMNGVFYSFLISQCTQCGRILNCNPEVIDWIPFQMRMQLVKLLDTWKAVVMRLEWLRNPPEITYMEGMPSITNTVSSNSVEIRLSSEKEESWWNLFNSMLWKVHWDAYQLRKLNAQHGILNAPVPDLEFWRQVCERELYEARLAAGEPVIFYKGHCCLYGNLGELAYEVLPGPYPGLQYYCFACAQDPGDEALFWEITNRKKADDRRMQYEPIPLDWNGRFQSPAAYRQMLAKEFGIIGPATYAEYRRQQGYEHAVVSAIHPELPVV